MNRHDAPVAQPTAMRTHVPALAALVALTAIWGLAQWDFSSLMYKLTALFPMQQGDWIPIVQGITYFLVALPAAMFHRRFGYKLGILIGLSLSAFGPFLIYPTIAEHSYPAFVMAGIVMTIGWPFIETSLNPLATELGSRDSAVRRLNFVQAFFPVGLVIGNFVALWLLRFDLHGAGTGWADATARPFVVIGIAVLLFALGIDKIRLPSLASDKGHGRMRDELRALLSRQDIRIGLAAIFACQLAQATIWGVVYGYVPQELPGAKADTAATAFFICCILAGVGRFGGTALMRWIEPRALLGIAMACAIVLLASSAVVRGEIGLGLLVGTSVFMAIAYPTIFGSVIVDLGPLKKTASGLLVTAAGIGSASELVLVYLLRDVMPARYVMLAAVPCFALVLVFARRRARVATPA